MTFHAEPLFDSLLLTEQMPWWHNADIEQAKKKKKNRTDFSGRPCSQFLENNKPSLELGDQVFTDQSVSSQRCLVASTEPDPPASL